MGCSHPGMTDAQPPVRVAVHSFWMEKTDVTNAQFATFVKATGYVTVAERAPNPADFPNVPREKLVAGSIVFTPTSKPVSLDNALQWWRYVKGANWRHPTGPQSSLKGLAAHPVVQVAWTDAVAYARWAHKRLPTEAEWEFAARGGFEGKAYVWGDTFKPAGRFRANTFQGSFPNRNTGADGYLRTSPVTAFPPNGYGLYDMAGNVWQWCADWYRPDTYALLALQKRVIHDPTGPANSLDPDEPGVKKRVQKGGSFLCTDQYCTRYMPGSRGKGEPDSASNNIGFRCVQDAAPSLRHAGVATD